MKTIIALVLTFSFVFSKATPPSPNDYSLKVNSAATLVLEGTVIKRDTINISKTESYFLFSLKPIHFFKGGVADNPIKLLVKRDLSVEKGEVIRAHGNSSWNGFLNNKYIFFLKEENGKVIQSNHYVFSVYPADAFVRFTDFEYEKYKAHAFGLHFESLSDLYSFIKLLPGNVVNKELTNPTLNRQEKKLTVIDTTGLYKKNKERKKIGDAYWKNLEEKNKNSQKKSQQRINNSGTLDVTLSNPTFTYGSTFTSLDFDIVLASSSTVYLENFLTRIEYNSTTFGSNAVQNGGIAVSAYPPFNSSSYENPDLIANDFTSNVVNIAIGTKSGIALSRSTIGTTPVKVLRVSMFILDCSGTSDIVTTDNSFTANLCRYTNSIDAPGSMFENFQDVNYNGTINPVLCKPNITNVSPTTVTAGTNSKITIEGLGFGNVRGNGAVLLKNADDNGASFISNNDNVDILSWTDNKIEYIVPSSVKASPDPSNSCSGTGEVLVKENTGKSSLSTFNVNIPYSILNVYNTQDSKKYPVYGAQKPGSPDGKMTFYLTSELYNKSDFRQLIRSALDDISCQTTVNFELAQSSVPDNMGNVNKDATSVISLESDNIFKPEQLMTTSRQVTETCLKGGQRWFINAETDITIKRSVNWSNLGYGKDLPIGQYDFYQAIIHELGHAAGLDHVIDNSAMMKPIADKGFILQNLRFDYSNYPQDPSTDGIVWLLNEGSKLDYTGSNCQSYYKMLKKNACRLGIAEERLSSNQFNVLTNPILESEIQIKPPVNFAGLSFKYQLFNLQGTSITSGKIIANPIINIPVEGLNPDLYLLVLVDEDFKQYTFKIVKQ